MKMKSIEFSAPPQELSCLLGNLFAELEPPCDVGEASCTLAVCGHTLNGNYARLLMFGDRCVFTGDPADLEAARCGPCLERRCARG